MDKRRNRLKKIPDSVKAGALRWWIAGMCYFFIGFGTQTGMFYDPVDLVFFLGTGIGLATILVYNPIAYGMFDMVRRGQIVNQAYYERRGWQNAAVKLAEIFKNLFLVFLVYMAYQSLNLFAERLLSLPAGTVTIPGEPFGFATLYLIFYQLFTGLTDKVKEAAKSTGNREGQHG